MNAPTFTKSGSKASTSAKLPKEVFEVDVKNNELLKQAYISYLAQGRSNLAIVKTRGLVRGGGRKPWRQKGTGRARFGSIRNPIWRGGGIVFGPTGHENFTKKLNSESKRLAIKQALSLKSKQIKVIETIDFADGKVSSAVKILNKLDADRNVLLVTSEKNNLKERATNNLPYLILTQAKYLNVYNILNANHIIISNKALAIINQWLGDAENV